MSHPQCTGYDAPQALDRRTFLDRFGMGLGGIALANLVGGEAAAAPTEKKPHFIPRAKRAFYPFQAGGPSQIDLLDPKPLLNEKHGT